MMMQHLDNAAVFNVLKKLSAETRHPSFLLATTFSNIANNAELDIHMRSRYRPLNLELSPFFLEPPLCLLSDGIDRYQPYMGLWRIPLMTTRASECSKTAKFLTPLNRHKFYSCVNWQLPTSTSNPV